jgi:hypothetical protein
MAAAASITLSLTAGVVLYAAQGAADGDALFALLALSVTLLIAAAFPTIRVAGRPRCSWSIKAIAAVFFVAALAAEALLLLRL